MAQGPRTGLEAGSFTTSQALCFSLLGAVSAFAYVPIVQIGALSVSVLATRYGFDLVALGTVLALTTVADAIWDPLIGVASDRCRPRWGPRRTWIAVGVPLTACTGLLLYFPRDDMDILWFAVLFVAFNLCASLFQVPYHAWATAATRDVRSRDRLYFVMPLVAWTASAMVLLMPLLPVFDTNALTLEVITVSLVVFVVLAPPSVYLLFRHVPETAPVARPAAAPGPAWADVLSLWRANPPFRFLILIQVVGGLGTSAGAGLFFFWFDSYLGLGEYVSMMGLAMLIPGLLAPAAGLWLTKRFSRNAVYVYASLAQAASGLVMLALTPDTPGLLPIMLGTTAVFSGGVGTLLATITRAVYADVTDYGRLRAGIEGGGLYVSIAGLVQKAQVTVFGSLGLIVVGMFGFHPGADSQSDEAVWALRITLAGVPIVFSTVAALMMWWFPLNQARMKTVSRRLASLDARGDQGPGVLVVSADRRG